MSEEQVPYEVQGEGTILRKENRIGYTHIDNDLCNAQGLSFRAKGIALVLLSKPDNWKVNIKYLMNLSGEGEQTIRTALHELAEYGFLMRKRERNAKGQLRTVTLIADYPAYINIGTTESRVRGYDLKTDPPETETSETDLSENRGSASRPFGNGEVIVNTDRLTTDIPITHTTTTNKKKKGATPPHPMTNPIKDAYVNAVGHKLPPSAFNKISPDAKFAAEQGVLPEEVEKTYVIMKLDEYWRGKTIPLRVVLEKIANTKETMRNRREEPNGQTGENPEWATKEMARIKSLRDQGKHDEAGDALVALQARVREMQRNGLANR